MDARKSLGLLGLSGAALVLGLLSTGAVACSAPAPEASGGTSSSVTQRAFDRNAVIDDTSMRDAEALTVADVQKFLDKTPWGTKSALAKYTENGKSAAQIMVDAAQSHGINPLEMLVRVQMEQGLVSKTTASTATIAIAFGCGCPHSPVCNDSYRGFANQAECAAGTMQRSMDKAVTSTGTVSGWARNKSKATEDGVTVLPKNAATAALYTYTPWVGEAGGGRTGVGGVSLHAQVWDRFAESVSYGAWAPATPATTDNASDPDAGAADPTTDDAGAVDPTPDPTPSTPDAGASTSDAGSHADAGPKGDKGKSGPPADGSEDGNILGEGSAPPSSNAPPPSTKTKTPSRPEELPTASEEELASKSKASAGGCSTTGHEGGSSNGLLIAGAAALALVASRRRRS
jgi:MYXO-CTERM domain-containing protein